MMTTNRADAIPRPPSGSQCAKRGLLARVLRALILPATVTAFESAYLRRMNRLALVFFWAHLPVFTLLAYLNDTGPALVALLTLGVLAIPTVALRTLRSERSKSLVLGFSAMSMGAVLVHLGQGPVQIEMHFYFFALLAMLALFANPLVIAVAAATVAVHHLGFWFFLPASVFNYDAPLWVVLVHATFVVLEAVAACFIARNFFDNVIGLEKKVEERTAEIGERNRDMRAVLDNVRQGLVAIDGRARLASEHSSALEALLGPCTEGMTFGEYLGATAPQLGAWFDVCWESLTDGFLPLEVAIEQLPKRAVVGGRHLRFAYEPVLVDGETLEKLLVVVTDVTADVERSRAESRQREVLSTFEHISSDRIGFVEFYEDATRQIARADASRDTDRSLTKRALHTVKGNAGAFGLDSVAELCHALEDRIAEGETDGLEADFAALLERWSTLSATIDRMLGAHDPETIAMTTAQYEHILRLAVEGASHADIVESLDDLRLEPAEQRFGRLAEQARVLAGRLEKGALEVEIEASGLRLERERFTGLWNAFTHVLRNAVDHGLERPDERRAQGKPLPARLRLSAREDDGNLVLEVADDGRGIDWERVRARADELELANVTEHDLVEALFASGLTTRDAVSTTSGRGVGLAAVREVCEELGGEVTVESEQGCGTTVRFTIPLSVTAGGSEIQMPRAA